MNAEILMNGYKDRSESETRQEQNWKGETIVHNVCQLRNLRWSNTMSMDSVLGTGVCVCLCECEKGRKNQMVKIEFRKFNSLHVRRKKGFFIRFGKFFFFCVPCLFIGGGVAEILFHRLTSEMNCESVRVVVQTTPFKPYGHLTFMAFTARAQRLHKNFIIAAVHAMACSRNAFGPMIFARVVNKWIGLFLSLTQMQCIPILDAIRKPENAQRRR